MAAYLKQKRASPGMVHASDLQITRPKSGVRPGNRDVHAYDGPLNFMSSPQNPDQLLSYQPLFKNNGNHIQTSQLDREIGKRNKNPNPLSLFTISPLNQLFSRSN